MKRFRLLIRNPVVVILAGSLLVFLLVVGLRTAGLLEFFELSAYDLFVRMQPKIVEEDRRITLVEISESDIQALGHWPLPDEALARSLRIILADGPRAVGVDIYRDIRVPPGSAELDKLFEENPQLIGIMTIGEKGIKPLPVIRGTEQAAFSDVLVDRDGIVRRGLLFLDDGRNVYNSFALRLAIVYLQRDGIAIRPDPENPQLVRLNKISVSPFEENDGGYSRADARGYQFLIDYRGMTSPFRTYSLSALLTGQVPSEAIADRIVLIGVSAPSVKDYFHTPLSLSSTEERQIPGVALHGQIVNQLLRFALVDQKPVSTMSEWLRGFWLLLWSLLGGVIGFRTRSASRFTAFAASGLLVLFGTAYEAFLFCWWIPLVPPALCFFNSAVIVTAYMIGQEKKERAVLMRIFAKHVSKEIAEMLWQQRDQFLLGGRLRSRKMMATILFSDLRGFSTMAERMAPQELIDWLNTYMEAMASLIMAHGGVVDNYVGDGIKADFGVPLPRANEEEIRRDAINAVDCALAMEREMTRLNRQWRAKGLPDMGIRVGIFTGPVVAGLLGSSERWKFTTVGDTVNIAARLESYDKDMGKDDLCRILIGDSTRQLLATSFRTEGIGEVCLKGKDERVAVYRVMGKREN